MQVCRSRRIYSFLEVLKEDNSSNVQITFSTEPTSKAESSTLKHNDSALEYKILKQIEFYFSDANILKDQYILKAVKSNKEGWVKLSTVAAFRRVQMLTSDEDLIRKVLRRSEQLEVSEDGKLFFTRLFSLQELEFDVGIHYLNGIDRSTKERCLLLISNRMNLLQ